MPRFAARVPFALLAGAALLALPAGCVTTNKPLDTPHTVVSPGDDSNTKLATLEANENGLVPAIVTRIIDPVTVVINANNPRTVKLAGVEPAPQKEFPELYDEGKVWMSSFIGGRNVVYVRPLPGTNLNDKNEPTITGAILLPDETGQGFVDVTYALLSRGLIRINDLQGFDSDAVRREAFRRQEKARLDGEGMWKKAS